MIDTYLNELYDKNKDMKKLNEGIIISTLIIYIVFMITVLARAEYNNKQKLKIAKDIYPKIKKQLDNLKRDAIPKIAIISKQLYNELLKLKGFDEIIQNLSDFLLNSNNIKKEFDKYINKVIDNAISKQKQSTILKITYIDIGFFSRKLHAIMYDTYGDDSVDIYRNPVYKIIQKYDDKVKKLCVPTFDFIEKIIKSELSRK